VSNGGIRSLWRLKDPWWSDTSRQNPWELIKEAAWTPIIQRVFNS
jgi:hypothetical protein